MNQFKLDTAELDRIARQLNLKKEGVARKVAFDIEDQAKQLAPRDTSALINSTYTVTQKEDGYDKASAAAKQLRPGVETEPHPKPTGNTIAYVGPCVEYAEPVELGHMTKPFTKSQGCQNFVPGQPYLVPAVEHVSKKFNSGETWKELFE